MDAENRAELDADARARDEALLQLLRDARAKLATGWTQGNFARDHLGAPISAQSPDATCWCAWGAVRASMDHDRALWAADDAAHDELYEALASVEGLDYAGAIVEYNDAAERTQADVLALFDRAIAAVEARLAPSAEAAQ